MTLHQLVSRVESKETFLEFVEDLRSDWEASRAKEKEQSSSFYEADANSWENPDLGGFLEAMHAWTQGMGDRVPAQPSWRTFAEMLMAAKIYE